MITDSFRPRRVRRFTSKLTVAVVLAAATPPLLAHVQPNVPNPGGAHSTGIEAALGATVLSTAFVSLTSTLSSASAPVSPGTTSGATGAVSASGIAASAG